MRRISKNRRAPERCRAASLSLVVRIFSFIDWSGSACTAHKPSERHGFCVQVVMLRGILALTHIPSLARLPSHCIRIEASHLMRKSAVSTSLWHSYHVLGVYLPHHLRIRTSPSLQVFGQLSTVQWPFETDQTRICTNTLFWKMRGDFNGSLFIPTWEAMNDSLYMGNHVMESI